MIVDDREIGMIGPPRSMQVLWPTRRFRAATEEIYLNPEIMSTNKFMREVTNQFKILQRHLSMELCSDLRPTTTQQLCWHILLPLKNNLVDTTSQRDEAQPHHSASTQESSIFLLECQRMFFPLGKKGGKDSYRYRFFWIRKKGKKEKQTGHLCYDERSQQLIGSRRRTYEEHYQSSSNCPKRNDRRNKTTLRYFWRIAFPYSD
jgi:hypothetical protein